MTSTFTTSDGVELAVSEHGLPNADTTVVMLHGWTEDHTLWERVVPLLGDDVRIVAPDFRGHGESALAPKGSANLERNADDVAELIGDRAPQGRIVLVGHSMGGMTMMALAERHPELVASRVAGAVFVSTSPMSMKDAMSRAPAPLVAAQAVQRRARKLQKRFFGGNRRPSQSAPRRGALPAGNERTAWLVTRLVAFGDEPEDAAIKATVAQAARTYQVNASEFYWSMAVHERADALPAYKAVPTAVLVGERDRLTPVEHARAIAAQLPSAEFVRFPGAGHQLPYERTDEVARIIRSVIAGRRVSRPSPAAGR